MTTPIVNNIPVYIGYENGSFFIEPTKIDILVPANGEYKPYFWQDWVE